tara:strand:- start:29 stop:379 length:351 start_codon:yes stop_codon:yes gene_type:complete
MFRNMSEEQRSAIDRSLEHHRVLECDPYTCETDGKNYIIVVYDVEDDGDCIKKSFGLLDDEGIPIRTPFCPSPYSGHRELIEWLEEGRPDDEQFQSKSIKRRLKLIEEQRKEMYGS